MNIKRKPALIAIGVILLALAVFIGVSFTFAPVFMSLFIACFSFGVLFIWTENVDHLWNRAHEAENRFWSILAFTFVCALFLAPDAPLRAVTDWSPLVSYLCITGFVMWVYHHDRILTRSQLTRPRHLQRVNSLVLSDPVSAKEKLTQINDMARDLDYRFVPLKALQQRAILEREQRILYLLGECDKEELNYVVTNLDLALLFYKMKDMDLMTLSSGRKNSRTALIELLAESRLADLSVTARVSVLDALQNLRLAALPKGEFWVRNILVHTTGRNLTKMKTILDSKGGVQNLHKLVWNDIRTPLIRHEILQHIAHQASLLQSQLQNPVTPLYDEDEDWEQDEIAPRQYRKILSDVDDTLYASGGRFPAGLDTRFPAHVVYPGVLTFYKELDLGSYPSNGQWPKDRAGNLAFLSARPHVYKDVTERKSYQMFEDFHRTRGLYTIPTLLAGNLNAGIKSFANDFVPMAHVKFQNFDGYAQFYPEFTFVFVGDNGQGDVIAAERMIAKYGSHVVEAAFIHRVQPIRLTPGFYPSATPTPAAAATNSKPAPTTTPAQSQDPNSKSSAAVPPIKVHVSPSATGATPAVPATVPLPAGGLRLSVPTTYAALTSAFAPPRGTSGGSPTPRHAEEDSEEKWARMGILFFDTYIGAAVLAAERRLIHASGLKRIARDAIRDFHAITLSVADREARRLELNADLIRANQFLNIRRTSFGSGRASRSSAALGYLRSPRNAGSASFGTSAFQDDGDMADIAPPPEFDDGGPAWLSPRTSFATSSGSAEAGGFGSGAGAGAGGSNDDEDADIPLIPAECVFFVGSSVQTPYGCGKVTAFRPIDGIYEIVIHQRVWALSGGQSVRVYMHGSELSWEWRADPGTPVSTVWGTGLLVDVRETDGIHVVALREMGAAAASLSSATNSATATDSKVAAANAAAAAAAAATAKLQHQRTASGDTKTAPASTAASVTVATGKPVTGSAVTPSPSPSPSPALRALPSASPLRHLPSLSLLPSLSMGGGSGSASSTPTAAATVSNAGQSTPPLPAPVPTPTPAPTVAAPPAANSTTSALLASLPPGTAIGYLNPDAVLPIKACVGERVGTAYGTGVVRRYRRSDNFYEVQFSWCVAYLHEDSIKRLETKLAGSRRRCVIQ